MWSPACTLVILWLAASGVMPSCGAGETNSRIPHGTFSIDTIPVCLSSSQLTKLSKFSTLLLGISPLFDVGAATSTSGASCQYE